MPTIPKIGLPIQIFGLGISKIGLQIPSEKISIPKIGLPIPFEKIPIQIFGLGISKIGLPIPSEKISIQIFGLQISFEKIPIDIATGPGTLACKVAKHVQSVHAVDFASDMVCKCKVNIERLGLTNVTVAAGDATALAFADGSFERAFMMFAMMFLPDRSFGWRELFRVLAPGGRALLTTWAPIERSPLMKARYDAFQKSNPGQADVKRQVVSLEDPEVLRREMQAAGFVDVNVTEVYCDLEFHSYDEVEQMMFQGNAPLAVLAATLPKAEWNRQKSFVDNELRTQFTHFPCRIGSTAWLTIGRKP